MGRWSLRQLGTRARMGKPTPSFAERRRNLWATRSVSVLISSRLTGNDRRRLRIGVLPSRIRAEHDGLCVYIGKYIHCCHYNIKVKGERNRSVWQSGRPRYGQEEMRNLLWFFASLVHEERVNYYVPQLQRIDTYDGCHLIFQWNILFQ